MKESEAVRIPALLAARQPRPTIEEATIDGIRMLVILGNEVDTVIRYNRSGGADMPQLSSYRDVAESAAHADERLAKQRASGRTNTTGEGFDWPRNWKLSAAKAAGKIWYARSESGRNVEAKNVVPEVQKQGKIVEEALALQARQALSEKPFKLGEDRRTFLEFPEKTEKAFYQTLPFPIAVVYRKIINAPNNTQRFSLLIELFEVVVRFIVLVILADYLTSPKEGQAMIQEIPEIGRLSAPTLGDWVSLFKSLLHHYENTDSLRFLKQIKDFNLDRYAKTLDEFVNIRNVSLRGHGTTQTEAEYEMRFQEHSPKLYKLIDGLRFLANYRLVKTGLMGRRGEFFKISVQILMGDNPHFASDYVLLRTPLETDKVLYLNPIGESLVLHPYIVLELCPECKRPEVLLLDKFQGQRITYLAYESGHKPSFPNSDQLPLTVRELAARRYPART